MTNPKPLRDSFQSFNNFFVASFCSDNPTNLETGHVYVLGSRFEVLLGTGSQNHRNASLRVDLNPPKNNPEGSYPDRSVSF